MFMKIGFFTAKSYDRKYFDKNNNCQTEIIYFETRLIRDTAQ